MNVGVEVRTLSDRSLGESRKAVDEPRGHAHRGRCEEAFSDGQAMDRTCRRSPWRFLYRDQAKALLLEGDEVLINRINVDRNRPALAP